MRSFAASILGLVVLTVLLAPAGPARAVDAYYSEVGFGDSVSLQTATPTVAAGSNTTLLSIANRDPRGIAVDEVNGKIYYGDGFTIGKMNLDGSSPATLISLGVTPGDIEVDPINGKIYYSTLFGTGTNGIFSANLDGTGITAIHTNASLALAGAPATVTVNDVYNLSIDIDSSLVYWTADDGSVSGKIGLNVSSTGGGGVSQLFVGASYGTSIDRMDIDFDASEVYYTVGSGTDEVRRSSLTGTGVTTLVSGLGRPGAIALDLTNDDMFFFVGGRIYQRELTGAAISDKLILGGGLFAASDMQIVVPETSTLLLAALGLGGVFLGARRNRSGITTLRHSG